MANKLQGYGNSYKIFNVFNHIFLIFVAFLCILPIINVLAVSFSTPEKATAGMVRLVPIDFNLEAYSYVFKNNAFWTSMGVSIKRLVLGTGIGMLITIFCAYPLSKSTGVFKQRRKYVWFFFFTMLFGGGMIPGFLVVYYTGLIDTIWSLVIPGAVNVWNIILLLNFFRGIPNELEEASFIDGAGHWTIMWRVYLPLSKPALATITLFTMVNHWNSWFDGMLYMKKMEHLPLQSYLQSLLSVESAQYLTIKEKALLAKLSPKTIRAAQIFITALPIMMVYPFLQKYFTKGLLLGSVKG